MILLGELNYYSTEKIYILSQKAKWYMMDGEKGNEDPFTQKQAVRWSLGYQAVAGDERDCVSRNY